MTTIRKPRFRFGFAAACLAAGASFVWMLGSSSSAADDAKFERRLYVAAPGLRDYLEYGGHGLLVFDVDHDHKFVKRIATAGLNGSGKPNNVKGICASLATNKVYISTIQQLMCLDLVTEKLLWERTYEGGCDRMSLTPDGRLIYLPSLEGPFWNVVRGEDGEIVAKVTLNSGAHNTVVGLKGNEAYLAGLKSPLLAVVDTTTQKVVRSVGPFAAPVRPFTVNGAQTLCFVNINELLGFEIGDLTTGRKLARVEVQGYEKGAIKRHGCPSHGIGLTPDEKELWIADAHNQRLHIFDATVMPPKQVDTIPLRDEPGWVTFSLDGTLAYPSTGDVIDVKTRRVVAQLADEKGGPVQSEKLLEIDVQGGKAVRAGDQFGLGRVMGR
jgi:DNA-binding beta-propeller fold protein YncE